MSRLKSSLTLGVVSLLAFAGTANAIVNDPLEPQERLQVNIVPPHKITPGKPFTVKIITTGDNVKPLRVHIGVWSVPADKALLAQRLRVAMLQPNKKVIRRVKLRVTRKRPTGITAAASAPDTYGSELHKATFRVLPTGQVMVRYTTVPPRK